MRRLDCHERLKQVYRNYQSSREISLIFTKIIKDNPQHLNDSDLTLGRVGDLAGELHDLYFARMFACFESILRDYWKTTVRDTKPLTEQLISSIAGRLGIPEDTLDIVDEIRDFRNFLVHGDHEVDRRFTIEEATGHLNTDLSRFPLLW
jgi:hypothetical protein